MAIWHIIRLHCYLFLIAQIFMVRTYVYVLSTQQILVLLTDDWYQGQHPCPFMSWREENVITWKKSRLPSVEIAASQWQLVSFRPLGSVLSTQQILDALTNDLYQGTHPIASIGFRSKYNVIWNKFRLSLLKNTASLLQMGNSCGLPHLVCVYQWLRAASYTVSHQK